MHSSTFHFPFLPLFYEITSLSGTDILSICNPVFQLKAEYTFIQLTSKPVTEEDIAFEWEVISGSEPLEFINTNTSNPTVIADPDLVIDTVFRVYINRGTEEEFSADMTAFRTPTDTASNVTKSVIYNMYNRSLAVNGNSFDNKFLLNLITPKEVKTIPSISSTFSSGSEGILATESSSFTAVITYPENFYRSGHKIEGISAYDPVTGNLIASTNFKTNIIEIPLNVATFYLTFDVNLNFYNSAKPTKRVFISDNKVRSSYLKEYNQNIKQLHLYVTEELVTGISKKLTTSNVSNKDVGLSLPQSLSFTEEASAVSKKFTNTASYNNQIQKFTPINHAAPDEFASIVTKDLSNASPINYVVTRLNGISIGG